MNDVGGREVRTPILEVDDRVPVVTGGDMTGGVGYWDHLGRSL
jgi:hypothetical protein